MADETGTSSLPSVQSNKQTKELKDRFAEEFSILTEDLFNIGILAVKESRKIQSDQQQQI